MRTEDFSYVLPEALIAQEPADPRDSSRLLVLHRDSGELEHRGFRDIVDYLRPGDVLVRNDSRVVPARLLGRRASGGKLEALLLRQNGDAATWEALVKPASRVLVGSAVEFTDQRDGSPVPAEVTAALPEGTRLLRFPSGVQPDLMGLLPLPPYIHRPVEDPERYQTVYARDPGSAAAPTAGLHFTPELLRNVEQMGVEVLSVTLHVGLDTFRPVRHDDPRAHGIHQEFYQLSAAVAQRLTMAAREGRRVFCVGTTAVRSVEDAAQRSGWTCETPRISQPPVRPYAGLTGLYILPGYCFRMVDALITNFHLPRTTLLMLVSAFAGRARILAAYEAAVRQRYRFYSFGDALLII